MNLEEYKGVFVFAQQVDNCVNSIAFELIGKGKDLAADLGSVKDSTGSHVPGLVELCQCSDQAGHFCLQNMIPVVILTLHNPHTRRN